MTCRRARQLLFDFVDGLSDEPLRAELDRHIGECAECERFAAEMKRALALIRCAPVEPLDENFNWKVRLAIHRERNAVHSRAESALAWARAWNLRYALGTGLAFGLVLAAGAVLLLRAEAVRPVALEAEPAQSRVEAPVTSLVPRAGTAPWRSGTDRLVSLGGPVTGGQAAYPGAIDESRLDARIDSLIAEDLVRMSPEERARYVHRWIARMQFHLQSQRDAPTQR